jgi:hypothetical protein
MSRCMRLSSLIFSVNVSRQSTRNVLLPSSALTAQYVSSRSFYSLTCSSGRLCVLTHLCVTCASPPLCDVSPRCAQVVHRSCAFAGCTVISTNRYLLRLKKARRKDVGAQRNDLSEHKTEHTRLKSRDVESRDALLVHNDALRLKQLQHRLINSRVHRAHHSASGHAPVKHQLSCNRGGHANLRAACNVMRRKETGCAYTVMAIAVSPWGMP